MTYRGDSAAQPVLQDGGTLYDGALYIERPADQDLLRCLLARELCYVLAPRQIGKSSLRVRVAQELKDRGVAVAALDLSSVVTASPPPPPEVLFRSVALLIARELGLERGLADAFQQELEHHAPAHCFVQLLGSHIAQALPRDAVIFLDEIDALRRLSYRDDFFVALRAAFNRRAEDTRYGRLTFCLLGVAQPGDLIEDETRTPFNVGRAIPLEDFSRREAEGFLVVLRDAPTDPRALLSEVLAWTDGTPYMTQKLLKEVLEQGRTVQAAVDSLFLGNEVTRDPGLTFADHCFRQRDTDPRVQQMLGLYRRLLFEDGVPAKGNEATQLALRLTGIVKVRRDAAGEWLTPRNRIFATVFNRAWLRDKEAQWLLTYRLHQWLEGGRREELLLHGADLEDVLVAVKNEDLDPQQGDFLRASDRERSRKLMEDYLRDRDRLLNRSVIPGLLVLASVLAVLLVMQMQMARVATRAERSAKRDAAHARHMERRAALSACSEGGSRATVQAGRCGGETDALVTALRAVGVGQRMGVPVPLVAVEGLGAALSATQGSRRLRGDVPAAVFSPDGQRVLAARSDNHARVFDARSGAVVLTLKGHGGLVWSAVYSPDGAQILTASFDRTARLWDARSGQVRLVLAAHTDKLWSAAFSPDGRRVITASADHTARVWDASSGQPLLVFRGHRGAVRSAGFSPDGRRAVTVGEEDRVAWVWDDLKPGTERLLSGHTDKVWSAAFSPDGARIVTASEDHTARVFDARSGAVLHVLKQHSDRVLSATFSPDGASIVTASEDHTSCLWDTRSGALLQVLQGHAGAVLSAEFSPDSKRVLTASKDGSARSWIAASGEPQAVLSGHAGSVLGARYAPDGQHVVTTSEDGPARVFGPDNEVAQQVLHGHHPWIWAVDLSRDGTLALTAGSEGDARVWDVRAGGPPRVLHGHSGAIQAAAFSPDGRRVVTAGIDGTARVWNARAAAPPVLLRGHEGPIVSARFSSDGSLVLTAGLDDKARLWEAGSGALRLTLRHSSTVRSALFSPDGQQLLTASLDTTARLWSANDGKLLHTLTGHNGGINGAVFSQDGLQVLTASYDFTARLWDISAEKQLLSLQGHSGTVTSAAFFDHDQRILTASADRTARVWDARSGKPLHILRHEGPVAAVQATPDGSWIVTIGGDNTARVWDAQTGAPILVLRGRRTRWGQREAQEPERPRTSGLALAIASDGARFLAALGDEEAYLSPLGLQPWVRTGCKILDDQPERRAPLTHPALARYEPSALVDLREVCAGPPR